MRGIQEMYKYTQRIQNHLEQTGLWLTVTVLDAFCLPPVSYVPPGCSLLIDFTPFLKFTIELSQQVLTKGDRRDKGKLGHGIYFSEYASLRDPFSWLCLCSYEDKLFLLLVSINLPLSLDYEA